MLPPELHGPGKAVRVSDSGIFIESNTRRFSDLDPDFISQICYEHPDRFNEILPDFDVTLHKALRVIRAARWILENIKYDNSKRINDEWAWHVDRFLKTGQQGSEILETMLKTRKWPFPPVIVEAEFARSLGAPDYIGEPYYLIEGTHRVSYLSRLVQLERIQLDASLELIEVKEKHAI